MKKSNKATADEVTRPRVAHAVSIGLLAALCLAGNALGEIPVENEIQKLLAADGAAGDVFGAQALALDGDTLVISALTDDDGTENSGSAYVFTRNGQGNWTESTKLTASDGAIADPAGAFGYLFGFAADVDGDTIAIGAVGAGSAGVSRSGAVYIFTRESGGAWSELVKLTASDGASGDSFGRYVTLENDTLAVAASRDDDGGDNSGSVYIFTRNAMGAWSEHQKLTASDAAADDNFGFALGMDGDSLIVAAHTVDAVANNAGAAYVFTRDENGDWSEQDKLTASDGAAGDFFGWRVDIDGDTAVINANHDDDNGDNSGSVYVFSRNGAGVWSEVDKLLASDGSADDSFGFPVTIEGDVILAGAIGDDDGGDRTGSAYLFVRDDSGVFQERKKLKPSDGAAGDSFGDALAMDGSTLVLGAANDDDNGEDSGSAYVFDIDLVGMDLNFHGPLHTIFEDLGGGVYSGIPLGTDFTVVINDATFSGTISDGITETPFDCCIAAGGLSVENDDEIFDAEDAAFINTLAGTNFVAGDVIDVIDIEGDATTAGGGRIEVGVSYILDPSAFDDSNSHHYPPDPGDILAVVYFIFEEDDESTEIYASIGLIQSNADTDGDGISGAIDGMFAGAFADRSEVFSNDFTDQHLGGATHGTVVSRSDNAVTVTDDVTDGVVLAASGGTGVSMVQMCGPSNIDIFNVFLTAGDQVTVTCGSFTGEVGTGEVVVTAGTNASVTLPAGARAFMDVLPGSMLSISNLGEMGSPAIAVTVNGIASSVGPGDPAFTTVLDLLPIQLADAGKSNGNSSTDLAVLLRDPVTGRNTVYVMDGDTGNTINALPFGKEPARGFTAVPDANGDQVAELGVLVEGSLFARIRSGANGTLLSKQKFNRNFAPIAFLSVGDAGGSVGPDVAVVGRNDATSKVQAQVRDVASGTLVKTISFSKAYIPFAAVAMANIDDSAAMEIAVLGVHANGQVRAQVKDAQSGKQIGAVFFNKQFTPLAFAAVPNAGGKRKLLAVLGRNAAGVVQVQVKRVVSGSLVGSVKFSKSYDPQAFISFADSNGSGGGEIAVIGVNAAGKVRAQVKEIADGAAVSTIFFSSKYPPVNALAINGVAGTGRNEIAVLGKNASGDYHLLIKDLLSGSLVNKVPVP